MTLQEIQYRAQSIISKWRDDDSAPYIEFVEELAHMIVPEPSEDLEEASSKFATLTTSDGVSVEFLYEKLSFQEGAKWQKEQIMKTAVNTTVHLEPGANPVIEIGVGRFGLKVRDKVRVIIVKEEN